MSTELKLEKVIDPADPRRCQGVDSMGQCLYIKVEGSDYCPRHRGNAGAKRAEAQRMHDYQLQVWAERIDQFSASERVTSLRGEVAILKLQLEQMMNTAKTAQQLEIYGSRIQALIRDIKAVVETISKLEARQGTLMDKSAALVLAGKIVDIIGEHVQDAETVDKISVSIIDLVAKIAGKELES